MANEILIAASLSSQFPKSPAAGQNPEIFASQALQVNTFTKAAALGTQEVLSVATTAAGVVIPLGGVTTLGWAWFLNLDVTNYVELGIQNGGTFFPLVRMNAEEPALFRLSQGITPYWRANTSACLVLKLILQN